LANTALMFPDVDDDGEVDDGGLEDGVFLLPVPVPWPAMAAGARTWELDAPGGAPIFILAALAPAGKEPFRPGAVVLVDGAPVAQPERYAVRLSLPNPSGPRDYAAMALIAPPPEPGRHTVTVACNACAPKDDPWLAKVNSGPRTYILHIQPPEPPATRAAQSEARLVAARASESLAGDAAPTPERRESGVVVDRSLFSEALGREMPYRIYLPPGYTDAASDTPGARRYPVIYLLHGLGASFKQFDNIGLIDELDRLASGSDQDFIAVMPAGKVGYWVNHADGGPRWGDYVARDIVRHVDSTYRTIATREARLLAGISMGGHGALQLSLSYPEVFGSVAAHSPALRPRAEAPPLLGGVAGIGPGTTLPPSAYEARDPISLVRRTLVARPVALWLDVGLQDRFAARASELHAILDQRHWAHEWRPAPGDHDPKYWRARVPDYVRFYTKALAAFAV
jgi:endo-1,4-beta-xylanase